MNAVHFCTYVVSLEKRRRDRLPAISELLREQDMKFTVWEAIEDSDGRIGLIKTLQHLLYFCNVRSFRKVLVLEDDARPLNRNVVASIINGVHQLPDDFDLYYLGCNLFQKEVELYSKNLINVRGAAATHAILYSPKGIKKALNALKDAEKAKEIIPVDMLYAKYIQPDGKSFCAFPMQFTQQNGYSDIMKRDVDYTKFLERRFDERTAHLRQTATRNQQPTIL